MLRPAYKTLLIYNFINNLFKDKNTYEITKMIIEKFNYSDTFIKNFKNEEIIDIIYINTLEYENIINDIFIKKDIIHIYLCNLLYFLQIIKEYNYNKIKNKLLKKK